MSTGIDAIFDARQTEDRAPSVVFARFDRDGLQHVGGRGTVGGSTPGADTAYRIASCTKSFTATALLALRDAGALQLDQPITDVVPAFADVALPTDDSPVPTLRMLLTMSGGLPTDDPWGDRQESITDDELDALLRRGLRFDSIPGTTFAYSNLGYALLGRAVQVAAGLPYREVIETTVLGPLGLTSTGFDASVRPAADVAVGHRRLGTTWYELPFSAPGAFSPIGGLFSTARDLARWATWLASAFDPEGRRDVDGVLSRASRREMQQLHRLAPGLGAHPAGYGFGLFVEQYPEAGPVISHSGGYPGFSAHMRWQAATGVGVLGFENATYAQVSVPVTSAFDGLLSESPASRVSVTPWAETRAAQAAVSAIVLGGDVPDGLFSENVEWDVPLEHRRALWAEAIASIGGVTAAPSGGARETLDPAAGEESKAPSHLVWRLPGAHGVLRVEIRLTPEDPPRVQTVNVRAETEH
ncbi:serine hydrolase domain-containing protein [Frigoribacterium sp. 2-23]|uniref:serine hydrolase domain-containing protein n=1 Tax=Frigoribacterium sp. 2-23 TaxID=3415006 RepID=UPI003C6F6F82